MSRKVEEAGECYFSLRADYERRCNVGASLMSYRFLGEKRASERVTREQQRVLPVRWTAPSVKFDNRSILSRTNRRVCRFFFPPLSRKYPILTSFESKNTFSFFFFAPDVSGSITLVLRNSEGPFKILARDKIREPQPISLFFHLVTYLERNTTRFLEIFTSTWK